MRYEILRYSNNNPRSKGYWIFPAGEAIGNDYELNVIVQLYNDKYSLATVSAQLRTQQQVLYCTITQVLTEPEDKNVLTSYYNTAAYIVSKL